MKLKALVTERYQDYKYPSMFIAVAGCDWKCCTEAGIPASVCQNEILSRGKDVEIPSDEIFNLYASNPITKAIVIGGLEPMLQIEDIIELIEVCRSHECQDDVVIYTGYYPNEVKEEILRLKEYNNIVIKFGRFIPNSEPVQDDVLSVELSSKNQFALRIS